MLKLFMNFIEFSCQGSENIVELVPVIWAPEMEAAWSENQIGDQNMENTDISNEDYLNLPGL